MVWTTNDCLLTVTLSEANVPYETDVSMYVLLGTFSKQIVQYIIHGAQLPVLFAHLNIYICINYYMNLLHVLFSFHL